MTTIQPTLNYRLSKKKRRASDPGSEIEVFEAVGRAEVDRVRKIVSKRARELGYRLPGNPWPANTPGFTAAPYVEDEKIWLGATITFERYRSGMFVPLTEAVGIENNPNTRVTGHVTSLGNTPKSLWVFVPEEGFYLLGIGGLTADGSSVEVERFCGETIGCGANNKENNMHTHDDAIHKYQNTFYAVYKHAKGYKVVHRGTGLIVPHLNAYRPASTSSVYIHYLRDAVALADMCAATPGLDVLERPTREVLIALAEKLRGMARNRNAKEI